MYTLVPLHTFTYPVYLEEACRQGVEMKGSSTVPSTTDAWGSPVPTSPERWLAAGFFQSLFFTYRMYCRVWFTNLACRYGGPHFYPIAQETWRVKRPRTGEGRGERDSFRHTRATCRCLQVFRQDGRMIPFPMKHNQILCTRSTWHRNCMQHATAGNPGGILTLHGVEDLMWYSRKGGELPSWGTWVWIPTLLWKCTGRPHKPSLNLPHRVVVRRWRREELCSKLLWVPFGRKVGYTLKKCKASLFKSSGQSSCELTYSQSPPEP